MKIKRFISALLCGTMLAAVLSTSVFAATFSDVENDATVAWAKAGNKRDDGQGIHKRL